ncbi:hypothetical protein [Xenorhabdus sp. BG5]|uniref:hypothetical protein n=1 Tax=Xenorhabdus sp. BG5 TaxID=2782014 RepID=UPI00187F610D|nr:hypothetical protein [Xenorhabdus sp. BG5]MBE8598278.1 hypothetical protein [Xenorhabdus sp. BG5]
MKIFILKHNIKEFKFYLQNENDPLAMEAFSFDGKALGKNWKPFSVNLFKVKTKAEKSLREDFNSSCFDIGLLFANNDISQLVTGITTYVEVLPINTDDQRDFYFINVIRKIPALDFKDKSEIMDMYRSGDYKFSKDTIINEMLFRDEVLTSTYFATENFVNKVGEDLKGVYFKYVGNI